MLEEIARPEALAGCYGCGPANEHGVQLDFRFDRAGARVVAEWRGQARFAGYRKFVHGGMVATLLDEAMGWALWALAEQVGMTRELTVTYVRPVFVGKDYRVIGTIISQDGGEALLDARVVDGRDRVAAEARGQFVFVNRNKAWDRPRTSSDPGPSRTG